MQAGLRWIAKGNSLCASTTFYFALRCFNSQARSVCLTEGEALKFASIQEQINGKHKNYVPRQGFTLTAGFKIVKPHLQKFRDLSRK